MTAGDHQPTAGELDARHGVAGALRFSQSALGGVVAELAAGGATAVVALKGGQVLSYIPASCGAAEAGHASDVLWLSPLARLDGARAVRGGIPVCWPWFGPHPREPAWPAHGMARTAAWQVLWTGKADGGVRLRLGFQPGAGVTGNPGHGVGVVLDVTLGDTLDLSLLTRNDGPDAIKITQALHSYFRVGDIGEVTIAGLEERAYVDQTNSGELCRPAGPVTLESEVDRIYVGTEDAVIVTDPSLGRRISVAKAGSASTVVWNPWIDKAARLGDLGPDGYRRFVCVETANAGSDRRIIVPGGSHTLRTSIAVAPL